MSEATNPDKWPPEAVATFLGVPVEVVLLEPGLTKETREGLKRAVLQRVVPTQEFLQRLLDEWIAAGHPAEYQRD